MGTIGSASDGEESQANTYSTLSQLRLLSHFTPADVPDSEVNSLIPEADRAILRFATIEVYDEKLFGDIDGSNKIFTTEHKPIADIDFDKDIDKDEVTVYRVDYDNEQNPVSTEIEVDTVNARDGIISVVNAPTTSNAELGLHADYRYYKDPVDFDMLTLAATYYLAHLCEVSMRDMPRETLQGKTGPSAIRSRWVSMVYACLPFSKPSLKIV